MTNQPFEGDRLRDTYDGWQVLPEQLTAVIWSHCQPTITQYKNLHCPLPNIFVSFSETLTFQPDSLICT